MESELVTPDFFISRTSTDSAWAEWIAQELERAGYSTFLQDWDFLPGHSFVENMRKGAECKRTIVVLSPEYLAADYTHPEWQAAFVRDPRGKERLLIPVLVKACKIPSLLAIYAYIDVIGRDPTEATKLLLDGVRGERLKRPVAYPGMAAAPMVAVAKLPSVNALLIGRSAELNAIDEAWRNREVRVVAIVAFGGVGKTALAIHWQRRSGVPGATRILGWSFHSQGVAENRQSSADLFLDYALRDWFGESEIPSDSWERGELLAKLIRRERTLLILDGLEPLQFPPGPQHGRLKDPGMLALLKELAAQSDGLCICTSRAPLTDLEDYSNLGALTIDLENLDPTDGARYLAHLGVQGSDRDLEQASRDFDNHALALTLLGNYIANRRGRDIRKRDTIPSLLGYDASKGGQARRILRHYEELFRGTPELDVLRLLGLFDRPAESGALAVVRKAQMKGLSDDGWAAALENLRDARLIEYEDPTGMVDCHPLVREHFAEEFRLCEPTGFTECHSLLYKYCSERGVRLPGTLEAMSILFSAVYHGCQADRHLDVRRDVYEARIQRGDEYFLRVRLGATSTDLSLLANFFTSPWSILSPSLENTKAGRWVLSAAGSALRSVGRLIEALDVITSSSQATLAAGDRRNASIDLLTLAESQLILGLVRDALTTARQTIGIADGTGDSFLSISSRCILGEALHQFGATDEAELLFVEAERKQIRAYPQFPFLYPLGGYLYCDLLLDQGKTDEVLVRSSRTIELEEAARRPLHTAVHHLCIGRALGQSAEALHHINQALDGFRKAGTVHYIPRGLLARATHYRLVSDFDACKKDLDEVRVLTTRAGMRLYLIDYHLEKARLDIAASHATEADQECGRAKELIQDTGYRRRDAEVLQLTRTLRTTSA